jgi:fructose-1,6-bisphosphatase-3
MSDIHGEYDAFLHILNSCSGEVKEKLLEVFGASLSQKEHSDLATLIYYPKSKMQLVSDSTPDMTEWYRTTLHQLVQVCRYVSIKHTRNKVRSYMPAGYAEIIDELIYTDQQEKLRKINAAP